MKYLFFPVLITFLLTSACSERNHSETIAYKIEIFNKQFGDCKNPDSLCAEIYFEYPVITSAFPEEVKNKLNSIVSENILSSYYESDLIKSPESFSEKFFNDYETFVSENESYYLPWSYEITIEVIQNSKGILTLQTSEYSFTGGAHPNSIVLYSSYNLKTADKIEHNDIFKKGYEKELKNIGEKYFRENRGLKHEENLEDAGFWFENNEFHLSDNWGIVNDGIIFYYNSYEISSYADGPTEILIPFNAIENIIDKNVILD